MPEDPAPQSPELLQYKIDELKRDVAALHAALGQVQSEFTSFKQKVADDEQRRLKLGIRVLGALVLAFAALVWNRAEVLLFPKPPTNP